MVSLPFALSRRSRLFSDLFVPRFKTRARQAIWTLSTVSASIGIGLCPAPNVFASNFSQIIFFGDSLTDSGYFSGVGQQPSFTTNPDLPWSQVLARQNGLKADPAFVLTNKGVTTRGGTNYAIGGARVSRPGFHELFPLIPSATDQINTYLASHPQPDKKALFSIWAGANDVFVYTEQNAAGLLPFQSPATQAATARLIIGDVAGEAVNVAGLIGRLQHAGVSKVMVLNLPDIGSTPLAAHLGLQRLWTAASYTFNQTLNQSIDKLGGDIIALDTFSLLNEVKRTPGLYGFKNVTSEACTSVGALGTIAAGLCTRDTLVEPDANRTYLFADGVHPTGAAHAILAQYVQSVLVAPSQISMLAAAPFVGAQAQTTAIDNRFRLFADSPTIVGKPQAYAVVNNLRQNYQKTDNMQGLEGSVNSATVGIDYALDPHWMIGAAFGYGQNKAGFGSNTGHFKLDQNMLAAYTQYRTGAWAINATGLAGLLQYNNVTRSIALGPAIRSETGKTAGNQLLMRLGTQYDVDIGLATLSPVVNLTWQQVKVDGYDEMGNDSTAMHFDQQTRTSLRSGLGLQFTSSRAMGSYFIQPFAKVTWEKEYKNTPNDVRAHIVGMGGSFGMPAYRGPVNTARLELGANIKLPASTTAFVAYSGEFAGGSKNNAFQLGVNKLF